MKRSEPLATEPGMIRSHIAVRVANWWASRNSGFQEAALAWLCARSTFATSARCW